MLSAYDRVRNCIEAATWVLTGALVLLVSCNVFARYVLEIGIMWAEELSRLVFVWVVFLGSYIALCRKSHMAIEIGVQSLPLHLQKPAILLSRLLVLTFLAVLFYAGAQLVQTTIGFQRMTPMLGISAGWGYASVPFAALMMFIEVLTQMFRGEAMPPSEADVALAHASEGTAS